jgi:hypothetical protein
MPKSNKKTEPKASSTSLPGKVKGVKRSTDTTLGWVEREYPQLVDWRALAVEWIGGETRSIAVKLEALSCFFERYLIRQGLALEPAVFLARNTVLPNFYQTACPQSIGGMKYNNCIHVFLHFVLLRKFSESADDGEPVISPAFRNPVPHLSGEGAPKRDESVYP